MEHDDRTEDLDPRLGAVLEDCLPDLHAYVRLRLGPEARRHEASVDVVQSVCADVLQYRRRFQHGGAEEFRHWLFRMAKRKLQNRHDFWRAERRDPRREVAGLDPGVAEQLVGAYGSVCTPSRAASAREQVERIERAFDRLSERHREVIVDAKIRGLDRAEMARERGISDQALRQLLARAMTALAAEIARAKA